MARDEGGLLLYAGAPLPSTWSASAAAPRTRGVAACVCLGRRGGWGAARAAGAEHTTNPNQRSQPLPLSLPEHRYYGESMPLGNLSLTNEGIKFLVRMSCIGGSRSEG